MAAKEIKGDSKAEAIINEATKFANANDTDVLIYRGGISRPIDDRLIIGCARRRRRKNCLMLLVTSGGDADPAYRIARFLQENYECLRVLVPDWCKSAGTLMCVAADEIIMTDTGELGPLDIQRVKSDEIGEFSSGLDLLNALDTAKVKAFAMLTEYAVDFKSGQC